MSKIQPTSIAAFKTQRPESGTVVEALLRKQYAVQVIRADGEGDAAGAITIAISSATPDRDNDTVSVAGWDLGNYRKNPVILWAHDSRQPPVGRSSREWVERALLMSTPDFTPADLYPFGHMIGRMVQGGWLNAASVGFRPLEWSYRDDARGFGVDFLKQELLEYSIVPIPANPEALVGAKSAGIDLAPLTSWAEQVLDGAFGKGFWLSRDTVERSWKQLAPPAVQVPAAMPTKAVAPPAPAPVAVPPPAPQVDLGKAIKDAVADTFSDLRRQLTGKLD